MVLDTNALILPFASRFPLETELRRVAPDRRIGVPSSVLAELDRLAVSGLAGASAALALAARFVEVPAPGRGDGALVALARQRAAWVVTSDRALRARIQAVGGTVLVPSGHDRLVIAGPRRTPPTADHSHRPRRGPGLTAAARPKRKGSGRIPVHQARRR